MNEPTGTTQPAEMFGMVLGAVIFLAVPIALIVLGNRRRRLTDGAKGKILVIVGWILLALVVLGMLANLSQQASTA